MDASGAGVPEAQVQVRNLDTNEVRAVETEPTGEFTIPNLAPGRYEVAMEKRGFRRLIETGLELQVDQTARLELQMQVGAVAETIEVKAEAPLLNTENAVKGDVIVNEEIAEMPLNGRDFGDLAHLVPGVYRKAQGGQGSNFAVNGARGDNTNFFVDGLNDQNPRGGAAQARPPIDAMQEFKMHVTNYSAEFGRLAGGVMNMVLKTGGNQPHGTLFEFLRNDMFDARNFFDRDKSKLRRNQFGGSLSGPVWIPNLYDGRDRTFFLVTWESYRQVFGQTRLGRVPTELERAGDFSQTRDAAGRLIQLRDPLASGACTAQEQGGCFPGNVIPADRIQSIARKLAGYYPLPNRAGQVNNHLVSATDADNWDSFLYKIDHRLASNDTLSFRYLKRYNDTSDPFAGSNLGIFGNVTDQHQSLMGFSYTRLFTTTLINEFRTGLTRTTSLEDSVWAGRDMAAELGIAGTTTDLKLVGFPRFTIRDLMTLGTDNNTPVQFTVNNLQWADTLTWVKSRHLLKFGGDVLRTQFFQPYYNNVRGTFNFLGRWTNEPFGDFLLGLLNNSSRQIGTTPNYLFQTTYGLFAQDDWKLRPDFTLNLGLRYEIMKPPVEKYGRWANFIPEYGQVILADDRTVPDLEQRVAEAGISGRVAVAQDYGLPRSLVYTRYRDLAPRFGFAWRPGRGNRTVVRGGYGLFYGNSVTNPVRNDLGNVFPFAVSQTFQRQTNNPNALTLSVPFREARGTIEGVTNTNGFELHPAAQYLQAWNLTIERELGRGSALEMAYVGSKGTHLGRKYNLNQPFRVPERRLPNGNFPRPLAEFNNIDYYAFGFNSTYNAGIVSLRRRMGGGFFYRVNYVYSKSIDNASQITGNSDGGYSGMQDARNFRAERGRSDWDTGHTVTMNFSYELPFGRGFWWRGWQLAGTGRLYTGQPFTPQLSNAQLDQGEANRPDHVAKGRLDVRTPERWFDLAAFPVVPPGAYRFGNSGRNILDGPGFAGVNVAVSKRFRLRERDALQFRCEAFNVSNHTNFDLPQVNVNAQNGGTITRADAARVLQFALRYVF